MAISFVTLGQDRDIIMGCGWVNLSGSRQTAPEPFQLYTCSDILYASRIMALNVNDSTFGDWLQLASRYAVAGPSMLITHNYLQTFLFPIGILRPNLLNVMTEPDM
jgi:hypothetical protein